MSKIDVNKCEFYNNNYCSCYIDNYGDCYHKCTDEELKYCHYKQLQKYKQCLDEIKMYCKSIKEDHYWGMREINFAQHILQRIKEVK